jgi:hypothetical protein
VKENGRRNKIKWRRDQLESSNSVLVANGHKFLVPGAGVVKNTMQARAAHHTTAATVYWACCSCAASVQAKLHARIAKKHSCVCGWSRTKYFLTSSSEHAWMARLHTCYIVLHEIRPCMRVCCENDTYAYATHVLHFATCPVRPLQCSFAATSWSEQALKLLFRAHRIACRTREDAWWPDSFIYYLVPNSLVASRSAILLYDFSIHRCRLIYMHVCVCVCIYIYIYIY